MVTERIIKISKFIERVKAGITIKAFGCYNKNLSS